MPDTICSCDEDLEYQPETDIFYASRIHRACPECGEAFRPQDKPVLYLNGVTGAESEIIGGAAYRFAIVIDCGKAFPFSEENIGATPDFIALSEAALAAPLYEIGYYD